MTLFSNLQRRRQQRAAYTRLKGALLDVADDIGLTQDEAVAAARQEIYGRA